MKNLVISVSPDSSLHLLSKYADVKVLDTDTTMDSNVVYDTVYIRSHFSQPSTLPQNFRKQIDAFVQRAKYNNPKIIFIDAMDTVDAIIAFEDKWQQYKIFGAFMPRTELYDDTFNTSTFSHPMYKRRLSSRGIGVAWAKEKTDSLLGEWMIQETIDIQEELSIYIVCGEVYPTAVVKQSMTEGSKAQGIDTRALTKDEIEFLLHILKQAPSLDIIGIGIARTADGELKLMEVNRSPGFAKFYELTGVNLAQKLYKTIEQYNERL